MNNIDLNSGLIFKWLKSENASNKESKRIARKTREFLNMSPKEYRKMLSEGRAKTKVLERLMSDNNWNLIDFSKIPSVAGIRYRNAFAHKGVTAARYAAFMADNKTTVKAATINPVDIAAQVLGNDCYSQPSLTKTDIDTLCKYWDNLTDYYQGREENAIAIIDVSGSMEGQPMHAAVGMGAYIAEKSHGPFANHFITFSHYPRLVEFYGDNIVDKMRRCARADWGMNTNIEAAMDLILDTAIKNHLSQKDLPARLYIFSDMEFDACMIDNSDQNINWPCTRKSKKSFETLFETIEKKFAAAGYEMPQITFWNLNARSNNIPAIGDKFNYISGFSMSQMEAIMAGKTAVDMMLDVLNKKRYSVLRVIGNFDAGETAMACSEI